MKKLKNFNKFDRYILISDIHLGVRNDSLEWLENIENYFNNFFIPTVKEELKYGNVAIIIAGDIFDNRQHLDINTLNVAQDIFDNILAIDKSIMIYSIIGNHDLYRKKTRTVTSLKALRSDRFVIINELSEGITKNNEKFLFIPWVGNSKQETEILREHSDYNYVIMHSDISGGVYDNGRQIINGANISVSSAKRVYSGHIHKAQINKNLTYIGSPYHLSRSDINNKKHLIVLYYSEDNTILQEKFILNTYSPRFIRLRLEEILNLSLEDLTKIIKNNYCDILVKDCDIKEFSVAKFINAIAESGYKKVEIITDKNEFSDTNEKIIKDNETIKNVSISEIVEETINNMSGISKKDKKNLLQMNKLYFAMASAEN